MKKYLRLIVEDSERKDASGKPYKDYYLVRGSERMRIRFVFRKDLPMFLSFLSDE